MFAMNFRFPALWSSPALLALLLVGCDRGIPPVGDQDERSQAVGRAADASAEGAEEVDDLDPVARFDAAIDRARRAHEAEDLLAMERAMEDAGTVALELVEQETMIAPEVRPYVGAVLVQQARMAAEQGDTDRSLRALTAASNLGALDIDMLEEDPRLAPVRQEHGEEIERLVETMRQQLRQEVVAEMEEAESYPFDFELPGLDGQPVQLADFRGRVVVVDIWGTWCPPCRQEIPHFVALQEKYEQAGLTIVGINYEHADDDEEARETIERFTAVQPINYPLVLGDEATQRQIPQFRGFPTTLFIDRSGHVRLTYVGARGKSTLEAAVQLLLEEEEEEA